MPQRSPVNSLQRGKAFDAQAAFADLLSEATTRGYFGSVTLTLHVQDGHIQHIRVGTERLLR